MKRVSLIIVAAALVGGSVLAGGLIRGSHVWVAKKDSATQTEFTDAGIAKPEACTRRIYSHEYYEYDLDLVSEVLALRKEVNALNRQVADLEAMVNP